MTDFSTLKLHAQGVYKLVSFTSVFVLTPKPDLTTFAKALFAKHIAVVDEIALATTPQRNQFEWLRGH